MKKLVLLFCILTFNFALVAQTPGLIIRNAGTGAAVLDPNGDGYVSQKTNGVQIGFTTPPNSDVLQSEIPFAPIIKKDTINDLLQGPGCMFNDLVGSENPDQYAAMAYFDGSNVLFRMRMANYVPNSKTYSILIDTDQKFGFTGENADPNAVPGNPGFEVEVAMITNFGVNVYNIDGSTNPSLHASNNYETYSQISVALSNFCADPDFFYDFYIPFSQLASIPGLNISTATPLRFSFNTNMQPKPSTGSNSIADEAGIPENQNPTPIDSINDGVDEITQCPTINSVFTSTLTIYGNSVEASGTIVRVYLYEANGTSLVAIGQSIVIENTWHLDIENFTPNVSSLAEGQIIKATAKAVDKVVSVDNCDAEVIYVCSGETGSPTNAEVQKLSSNNGYKLALNNRPAGTLVYIYNSDYSLRSVLDLKNGVLNPYTTTANNQTFNFECSSAGCFTNQVYIFRFQEPGKCISADYFSCDYASTEASEAPTLLSDPLTPTHTSILGEGNSANAQILMYVNERYLKTVITSATAPYGFTIPIADLKIGDYIELRQIENGKCISDPTSIDVSRIALAPRILNPACNETYNISSIWGTSVEQAGSIIGVYKLQPLRTTLGYTSVQANGTWSLSGLSIAVGDVITAAVTGGVYLSASTDGDTIEFVQMSDVSSYSININTPQEAQTTVSGSISGTIFPVEINLYASGSLIGTGTVHTNGAWTITNLLTTDLAIGSLIQASITQAGYCESGFSTSTATVECMPPIALPISAAITEICEGSLAQITIQNSELNVYYVPVLVSDTSIFGYGQMGNGETIHLITDTIRANVQVSVLESKLPIGSCTTLASNAIEFTVKTNPAPPVSNLNKTLCFNKQVEDIEVGLAEFAIVNWYDSPTGGNLINANTSLIHGTSYYGESELAGCVSTSRTAVTVYLDMVPDTTSWLGSTSTNWNDDANWTLGVPGDCSFAIIPNLSDLYYPIISDTARVNGILFQAGSGVLGLQHLYYNKAYVDLDLKRNVWYTLTTPLKSMFSGDYYTTGAPLTAIKLFDTVNPDKIGSTSTQGTWTNSFANLITELNPGEGFAYWVDHRSIIYPAITSYDTTALSLQLPRRDENGNLITNLYPYSGVTGKIYYTMPQSIPKDTSLAYRFAMENSNGVLQDVYVAIKPGLNLVGNPLMSHLDFNKLYLSNIGLISNNVKFWNGSSFVSFMAGEDIITDMDLSHTIIPPMQSFFVHANTYGLLHIDLDQHFVADNTNMLRVAQAAKPVLHIKASMGKYESFTALAHNPLARNNFGSDDVFKLFSQYNEVPEIYTTADDKTLDINQFSKLPYLTSLGIKTTAKGSIKLNFEGLENFEETELTLINTETGEQQNLKENSEYTLYADGRNLDGNLFIEFRSAQNTSNEHQNKICTDNCMQAYFKNGNFYANTSASDKIKTITIWDELGLQLYRNSNLNHVNFDIELNTKSKVCVARIETELGVHIVKILVE